MSESAVAVLDDRRLTERIERHRAARRAAVRLHSRGQTAVRFVAMLVLAVPLLVFVHYVIYLVQIGSAAATPVALGILAVPFVFVFVSMVVSILV